MDELGCYMAAAPDVVHSHALPEGQSGELLNFSRESVQWEWMSMSARRLNPGETYSARTQAEEAAFVLLGGRCTADWAMARTQSGSGRMFLTACRTPCISRRDIRSHSRRRRFAKLPSAECPPRPSCNLS